MRRLIYFLLTVLLILGSTGSYLLYKKHKSLDTLVLFGNVDVRQVDLGFRVLGRVTSMPFQEGEFVAQGTLMAILDKQPFEDEVLQAEANVVAIQANLNNAKRLVKRRKAILDQGAVAQEDYENAVASRDVFQANLKQAKAALGVSLTALHDTELYAPSDGTILTRIREPGAIVPIGDSIYTLSLCNPIWVRAFVAEPELGLIYPGMKAEVFTDTQGGPTYQGHIGFISPVAEFTPKTVETTQLRTDLVYRLRIIVDNPDQGLRQGMPVTVRLPLKAAV